jgi:hypothetical protein
VPRLTVAFDILGQRVMDSPELVSSSDPYSTATGTPANFANIHFTQGTNFNVANGAVGFKLNVAERLLLGFNLLFKMNDAGLRDKVTPLFGLEYSFF